MRIPRRAGGLRERFRAPLKGRLLKGFIAAMFCAGAVNAAADESGTRLAAGGQAGADQNDPAFVELYALGVGEYETDDFTTVTGWRFNDSWHFGYQDGEDSGLSLVWQNSRDQMSLSHHGIRFTRRF